MQVTASKYKSEERKNHNEYHKICSTSRSLTFSRIQIICIVYNVSSTLCTHHVYNYGSPDTNDREKEEKRENVAKPIIDGASLCRIKKT